jgi:hypothetical protein
MPGLRETSSLEENTKYLAFYNEIADREQLNVAPPRDPAEPETGRSDITTTSKASKASKASKGGGINYGKSQRRSSHGSRSSFGSQRKERVGPDPASFLSLISHETAEGSSWEDVPDGGEVEETPPVVAKPAEMSFLNMATMHMPVPRMPTLSRRPAPPKEALAIRSNASLSPPYTGSVVPDPDCVSVNSNDSNDTDHFPDNGSGDTGRGSQRSRSNRVLSLNIPLSQGGNIPPLGSTYLGRTSVDTEQFDKLMAKKASEYDEITKLSNQHRSPATSTRRNTGRGQGSGRLIEYPDGSDISLASDSNETAKITLVDRLGNSPGR